MTRRAFAKVGSARFVFDDENPEFIYAEEECFTLLTNRTYWHGAGKVPMKDIRRAVAVGIELQWRAPQLGTCLALRGRHSVRLTAHETSLVLVALDQALEAGMPRRIARDVKKGPTP